MFKCSCCQPPREYSSTKSLYHHQRVNDPNYLSPYDRRKLEYYSAPNKCQCCEAVISYEDFTSRTKIKYCSQSCAGKINGVLFPKRIAKERKPYIRGPRKIVAGTCIQCEGPTKAKTSSYCSTQCHQDFRWEQSKNDPNTVWSSQTRKRFLLDKHGHQCSKCHNSVWNGVPIPLEIEHINGNSEDNSEENVTLLCPNCHAQTPTYKSKNRGNGRHFRRTRYAEGNSY